MKKILFVALAALGLTACMQNEELAAPKGDAIQFDNAFVENSVRGELYDNNTLESFNVYGTMSNAAQTINIFNGVEVIKNGGVWGYAADKTQYWIDGYDYDFVAVVDGVVVTDTTNGMPATISVDMSQQKDVLYAAVENAQHNAPVSFTFNHLLSKAKVTVNNAMTANSGFAYTIESIKITNAEKNGVYDLSSWTATEAYEAEFTIAHTPISFDSTLSSTNELLLIPGDDKVLDIEVVYSLWLGDDRLQTVTKNLTAVLDFKQGNAYNFIISLGNPGDTVEFDAVLKDWNNGGDYQMPKVLVNGTECYQEFSAAWARAMELGEATLKLVDDVVLNTNESVVVAPGKSVTLQLNGKTLSGEKLCTSSYAMIENKGTLVIEGDGTISFKDTGAGDPTFGWGSYTIANYNTLVVNGGTIQNVTTLNEDSVKHMYCAIQQGSNAVSLTVNGGKFHTNAYRTIRANGGAVVLNGGVYEGQVWMQPYVSTSSLTINGGSFAPQGGDGSSVFVTNDQYNVAFAVNGGTFATKIGCSVPANAAGAITAGVFTTDAKNNTNVTLISTNSQWGGNDELTLSVKGFYQDASGNYHVATAEGWLEMADQSDNFFGSKTVYLDNDIDFAGKPIRVTKMYIPEYFATFDGQNHTISNAFMADGWTQNNQALFDGHMNIKNLTVVDSHVYGQSAVGIIGAYISGTIDNCHVKRCRSYGYVWQVGGIVGLHSWNEIKNCSVEDTKVECFYYGAVGAIVGCMNEMSRNVTGCTVKNCTLIKEGSEYPDYDPLFGVVVGYAAAQGNYVFDCEVENVTIKGAASSQLYGEVPAGSTVNGVQL